MIVQLRLSHVARPLLVFSVEVLCLTALVVAAHGLSEPNPTAAPWIPSGAIGAFGSALAIFLAFRNQSAYARWWEARKLWGTIVNESRTWARRALSCVGTQRESPHPEAVELSQELVARQIAWVKTLASQLRGEGTPPREALAPFLSPRDDALFEAPNAATFLLHLQGLDLARAQREGWLSELREQLLHETLSGLVDAQGGCERIKGTPFPRQYDSFPRAFTYAYVIYLPFYLVEALGWLTPLVSWPLCVAFLILEFSGRVLEDPFEPNRYATATGAIGNTIERDLQFLLGRPLPEPHEVQDGVLG